MKKSSAPKEELSTAKADAKSNARNAALYNKFLPAPKTGKVDLDRPKGMVYEKPKDPMKLEQITSAQSSTAVAPPVKALRPEIAPGTEEYVKRMNTHKKTAPSFMDKFLYGNMPKYDEGIIPETAKALSQKLLLNSYNRDDNTFDPESKAILYKVGENAQKRTGKLNTGTKYEDYKGVVSDEEYDEIIKLNKMNVTPEAIVNASSSRGYNLATSMGRFSVAGDGKGKQIQTDSYDFINEDTNNADGTVKEKTFKGKTTIFAELRKELARRDGKLSPKELKNLKTSIVLTPQDTVGFGNRPKGKILLK